LPVCHDPWVKVVTYHEHLTLPGCTNHAGNRLDLQVYPQLVTNQELAQAYNLTTTLTATRLRNGVNAKGLKVLSTAHNDSMAPYNPQCGGGDA